jgi:hypothetical protein
MYCGLYPFAALPDRCQRLSAAFLAISDRCSGVSFAARALPPLRPPLRPNATAAGSFTCSGSAPESSSWVASPTMDAASEFRSAGRLRERSGISPIVPHDPSHVTDPRSVKLTHYRCPANLDAAMRAMVFSASVNGH